MRIALAGMNHKTAPVELREQLALPPEAIPDVLLSLQRDGIAEAVVLSTCNRVEITAVLPDDVPSSALLNGLRAGRIELGVAERHTYVHEQENAIVHLFRVASSLDSMIVGEPQILGQLKRAYLQARDLGAVGTILDSVMTRAFHCAKRVRSETGIGQSAVSVSYAAVELAREIFGSLNRKQVLIVGAGKMSEATARHLLSAGVAKTLITNRTHERAEDLARTFHGDTVPYERFAQRLPDVDIVITSSAAPEYIIEPEMVRRALELRKNQPMFFIDIAVPRNIDPRVNDIEHAFLYDIDDLAGLASRNMASRREVAREAERMVAEEATRVLARLRERDVVPTIQSFQAQLEAIRQEMLARFRPRLGTLTPAQDEALEAMTRGIVNKIAHGPISEMRREAAEAAQSSESEFVSAVRRMFRLGQK